MQVGILNLQHTRFNYGAVLQAAALEQFIQRHTAYSVEHIDFFPPAPVPRKLKLLTRAKLKFKGVIKRHIGRNRSESAFNIFDVQGGAGFETFRNKWIHRTETVTSLEQLKRVSSDYDIGIVGSDQIWRLLYTRHTFPAFFLGTFSEQCRKVAYAASFGTDAWEGTPEETEQATACLQGFDAVSVRENSGVAICRDLFGIEAQHVLDPTLLIGRTFFDQIIDEEGVEVAVHDCVYYKLRGGTCGFEEVQGLTDLMGYTIENIYYIPVSGPSGDAGLRFNSVGEWLARIRDCRRALITDSFHGICFAILFEKNFIWIPNKGAGTSRLESLLGELGLLDRRCESLRQMKRILTDKDIDYAKVNEKLAALRKSSERFLLDALLEEEKS